MIKKILKSRLILILAMVGVLALLVWMAYQQSWQYHLSVDVWGFYYPRFLYALKNNTFGGFGPNEYFPGTMFFFLIPGAISQIFPISNWQSYFVGLILVNVILIMILLFIYRKHSLISPYIFLSTLLFSGPIMFFRHDLYVSLIVIGAILLIKAKKYDLAALILGIATSIKIYPALIFPYLLIVTKNGQDIRSFLRLTVYFIIGFLTVIFLYLLLGASTVDITGAIKINSIKPVHVESIWGTLVTFYSQLTSGSWSRGLGSSGIFGIDPKYFLLPLAFYNYFWVLPILLFYFLIYRNLQKLAGFKVEVVFLIVLLFEIFSKILAAQYLFWFLTLFPLLSWSERSKFLMVISFLIIQVIVFLSQYIYPLHYNELLGIFYTTGKEAKYFYLLSLRNLLLIVLFGLILSHTYKSESKIVTDHGK